MRSRTLLAAILGVGLFAGEAVSQSPPAKAEAPPPPKNLQFFPKDTPRPQLIQTMRGFCFALGVRCEHCHVDEGPNGRRDFAADEKPAKEKARAMLRMTQRINDELLAAVPGRSTPPVRVQCMTCHHGLSKPELLAERLHTVAAQGGPDSAVATLRSLHADAVSGEFDVSEWGVNEAARTFTEEGKTDVSLALLRANATLNPESKSVPMLLAEVHTARGEKAEAIEILRKVLTGDPENQRAKRMLEQLESPSSGPKP